MEKIKCFLLSLLKFVFVKRQGENRSSTTLNNDWNPSNVLKKWSKHHMGRSFLRAGSVENNFGYNSNYHSLVIITA